MDKDEVFETVLREKNIFPPSVQDSQYGGKAEMTRTEIIEKTLREMGILSLSEQDAQSSDKADFLSGVITELQRRLQLPKLLPPAVVRLGRDLRIPAGLRRRLPIGYFHLDLPEQIHNLLRLKPLRWHDPSSSSVEFPLISTGTGNPGHINRQGG